MASNVSVTNSTESITYGLDNSGITQNGINSIQTTNGHNNGQLASLGLPVNQGTLGIMRQTYFIVVACACIFGNGLTLYAVATTERLKVKAYAFTTSLSVSDFLYGFRLAIITGYGIASGDACASAGSRSYVRPIEKFLDYTTLFNIGSVATDRFIAVLYPLHYQNIVTPSTIRNILVGVWGVPFIAAFTPYLGLLNNPRIGEHTSCLATLWPVYEVVLETILFAINSALVVYVYSRIWSAAMRVNMIEIQYRHQSHRFSSSSGQAITSISASISQSNGNSNRVMISTNQFTKQWRKISEKLSKVSRLIEDQRVTRTVMTLMAIYIIFWFPYFFSRMTGLFYGTAIMQYIQSYGGAMGITCMGLNVFVYNYTNKDFRRAFRRILRRGMNEVGPMPH